MIPAADFADRLLAAGFDAATGVPCSCFGGPIVELTRRGRYTPAVNEGAALALAAGATTAGHRTVVLLQNSGYGNLVNPLTSLLMPYRIPVLAFMSLRGWPDPGGDEPQHAVMGATTHDQLDAVGVGHWTLSPAASTLDEALAPALAELAEGRPAFVLVPKGAVGAARDDGGTTGAPRAAATRAQVLRRITEALPDAAYVATTGYTSRELFAVCDSPRNFYMQGSMGHALPFALGVARAAEHRRTVVLDGDGALLMHLGSLATAAAVAPPQFVHVVLDNGVYESTGGQATGSGAVSFAGLARAAGYRAVHSCPALADLDAALRAVTEGPGPHLIAVRTAAHGTGQAPPRATSALSARDIRERFAAALAGTGTEPATEPGAGTAPADAR
ncbi:phosphonopyruvate decarboxylase [Streptomyces capparidis]